MIKKYFIIFLSFSLATISFAQEEKIKAFSVVDSGIEFQIYPTGYLTGFRLETNLSNKEALNFRLGMNVFNHKDLPKRAGINDHISETGSGYGFSLGYRRYFRQTVKNFFLGVRTDLWFNKVTWKKETIITKNEGVTNIVVLQPTIETGWLFELGKNKNVTLSPNMAFGYEWNIYKDNEQTGNGFIILGGLSLGYRFAFKH